MLTANTKDYTKFGTYLKRIQGIPYVLGKTILVLVRTISKGFSFKGGKLTVRNIEGRRPWCLGYPATLSLGVISKGPANLMGFTTSRGSSRLRKLGDYCLSLRGEPDVFHWQPSKLKKSVRLGFLTTYEFFGGKLHEEAHELATHGDRLQLGDIYSESRRQTTKPEEYITIHELVGLIEHNDGIGRKYENINRRSDSVKEYVLSISSFGKTYVIHSVATEHGNVCSRFKDVKIVIPPGGSYLFKFKSRFKLRYATITCTSGHDDKEDSALFTERLFYDLEYSRKIRDDRIFVGMPIDCVLTYIPEHIIVN